MRTLTLAPRAPDPDGDQIEVVAWFDPATLPTMPALRAEFRDADWDLILRACNGEDCGEKGLAGRFREALHRRDREGQFTESGSGVAGRRVAVADSGLPFVPPTAVGAPKPKPRDDDDEPFFVPTVGDSRPHGASEFDDEREARWYEQAIDRARERIRDAGVDNADRDLELGFVKYTARPRTRADVLRWLESHDVGKDDAEGIAGHFREHYNIKSEAKFTQFREAMHPRDVLGQFRGRGGGVLASPSHVPDAGPEQVAGLEIGGTYTVRTRDAVVHSGLRYRGRWRRVATFVDAADRRVEILLDDIDGLRREEPSPSGTGAMRPMADTLGFGPKSVEALVEGSMFDVETRSGFQVSDVEYRGCWKGVHRFAGANGARIEILAADIGNVAAVKGVEQDVGQRVHPDVQGDYGLVQPEDAARTTTERATVEDLDAAEAGEDLPKGLAGRPVHFDPSDHPRDWRGRFHNTGGPAHGVGVIAAGDPNTTFVQPAPQGPGESDEVFHERIFAQRERYAPAKVCWDCAFGYRTDHELRSPPTDVTEQRADLAKGRAVARWFLTHSDPDSVETRAAYADLVVQVKAQLSAIERAGVTVEYLSPQDIRDRGLDPAGLNPYPTAKAMADDMERGRLMIASLADYPDSYHPILDSSRGGEYDQFRAVHDFFGHGSAGVGFDRHGEYQAWLTHLTMFTGEARRAMTAELHAENSVLYTTHKPAPHLATMLPDELMSPYDDAGRIVRK